MPRRRRPSASPASEHAEASGSSAVSSPLRWPRLPRAIVGVTEFGEQILEPIHKIDPAVVRAYDKLVNICGAKQGMQFHPFFSLPWNTFLLILISLVMLSRKTKPFIYIRTNALLIYT